MPIAKPTALPEWGTDAGATFDPGLATRQAGWLANTRAAARVLNWFQERTYRWLAYFSDIVSVAFTDVPIVPIYISGFTYDRANTYWQCGTGGTLTIPIPAKVGDRLTAVEVQSTQLSTGIDDSLVTLAVYKTNGVSAPTIIGTASVIGGGGALIATCNYTIVDDDKLTVEVVATSFVVPLAYFRAYHLLVGTDRP